MQQQILPIKITDKSEIYYINKAKKEIETIQNQEQKSCDDEQSYQDEYWKTATAHKKRKVIPGPGVMNFTYRKVTMPTRHLTPKFIRFTHKRNRYGPKRKGHN